MLRRLSRASSEKLAKGIREFGQRVVRTSDSIGNYLTGLGTSQDATLAGRPDGIEDRLNATELNVLYVVDDLARRIVEEPVDDAIRGGWELFDSSQTVQLKFPAHLNVTEALRKAWCWGRLHGRGAVVMVPYDTMVDLSQPRPPGDMGIANLLAVSGEEMSPVDYEVDARYPNFGRACSYQITPRTNGLVADRMLRFDRVHESWLLIFEGNMLPPEFRTLTDDSEDSVLQAVWGVLRRFLQTEQALASIVTRFETATISISGLTSALSAVDGTELLTRRMGLFTQSLSLLNAALIDADSGEKYERKFAQVAGLEGIWDRMAHSVAKASGIPMTRLFGMSPSGLGTDDKAGRANWRGRVAGMQMLALAPALVRLASACGVEGLVVDFPPLDEVAPEDKAVMDETFARMATQSIGAGFLTVQEARVMAKRRGWPLDTSMPMATPAPLVTPGAYANPAAVAQLPATSGGGAAALNK